MTSRRRLGLAAGVAAVLAMHATLLWIAWWPEPRRPWGDERMYTAAAGALANGGAGPSVPLWPPLYAQFVGMLLRVGGGSVLALQLAQTALLAWTAWLARDLWRRLAGPDAWGDGLALLVLGFPPLAAFAHYLWPEVLHLALFTSALWILAARRERPAWLVLLGVVLGAALSTKHLLAAFVPVLLVPVAAGAGTARAKLGRLALVVAAGLATLAPWALTGASSLGSSARFNLWVGLNERSRQGFEDEIVGVEYRRYVESAAEPRARDAILERKLRALVAERGLASVLGHQLSIQYFRLFDRDSFLTQQLPGGAIARRGAGYVGTPVPLGQALRASSCTLWTIVLAAGAFGVAVCPPRGRRWMWLGLAFLGYNLLLFLFVHVKSRYRIQFLPLLMAWALLGMRAVHRAWRDPASPERIGRGALASGAAAALLALFLAHGGALLDGP